MQHFPWSQYKNRPGLLAAALTTYVVYVTAPCWFPLVVLRAFLP